MNYLAPLIFISLVFIIEGILFDSYSGKKIEDAQEKELQMFNASLQCSIDIKNCTPHEGRRPDGTCNNFEKPSRGAARGPYMRLLKHDYANHRDIRKDKNGEDLPSARRVRTELYTTGRVVNKHKFTIAAYHMLEFIHRDVSLLNGLRDYLRRRQHCCQPQGNSDPRCIPIIVPHDDPYLKVTDIRCLNFSRAETFQDTGCTPEIIPPEQINFQTPIIDLSTIYGVDNSSLSAIRKRENGLLILENRNNRYVPTTNRTQNNITDDFCMQNRDNETICYDFETLGLWSPEALCLYKELSRRLFSSSDDQRASIYLGQRISMVIQLDNVASLLGFPEAGNLNLRTTTLGIFFMREHNRIAKALSKINPCWKDDRLFKVAREINVATAANIFMYELLPLFLGYKNMLHNDLISESPEHISLYDEKTDPLVYAEFEVAIRYFNTLLDGRVTMYTEDYHYLDQLSVSETMYRQALIEEDNNFETINRGTFYQYAGKIDDILDPEISENYYGNLQRAHDAIAIAIQRGRDMGLRGYNDYRHICGLKQAKRFEDFTDVMETEKIAALKKLYKDITDVDLLAGIMSENKIEGTSVGPTLFCIIAKQLQVFRFSDRFWYERGDQFHSFNLAQLREIRITNMSQFACNNAEGIKYIQPQAFLNVKEGNHPVPCTHLIGPDLTKWEDESCSAHKIKSNKNSNHILKQITKVQPELLKDMKEMEYPNFPMDYSSFFNQMNPVL